jgi:hypothetical protein
MDAVLCLREATHFQSMELERPEAICGLESGTRSRLWSTRRDCPCRQDVAFFGLGLAGTEIACLNQFSFSIFVVPDLVGIEEIMNPTSALSSPQNSNPLLAILWAGFTCGTLDISAALVVYRYFGRPPKRLLQGIAAGVLGSRSFQGGLPTAFFGLFCHFFIAFFAATVYLTASRWIPFLLAHAVISGVFYGVAVYFFMNRVVVPLSGAIKYPFSLQLLVIGVVIHIFCVGLPIALVVRQCSMQ